VKQMLGAIPEGEGVDPEDLIGLNSILEVEHETGNDGKVYARITRIKRVKTRNLTVSPNFVRQKDKPTLTASSRMTYAPPKARIPSQMTQDDDDNLPADVLAAGATSTFSNYEATDEDVAM
jgi:hypothetical protein